MIRSNNEFTKGAPVLFASFLGVALGLSSLYFYSFGIFIKPLAAEFGWSRGEASLGMLIGTICSALVSVPVGKLVDKIGAVLVGLASLLFLSFGFLGIGILTNGLISFLCLTAVLSLLTTGSTGVSFNRLVVDSFDKHRGIALGIVLSGAGVGAVLIPRFLTPYVEQEGWRPGYIALGVIILIALPLIALLLRGSQVRSDQTVAPVSLRSVVTSPAFIWISGIFLTASIAIIGTVVHFVPLLTDQGMNALEAGKTASLIGIAAILGRLVAGAMLDRFSGSLVTSVLFVIASMGLVVIGYGPSHFVWLGALITGLAIGAEVDLMAYLTSRYFPKQVFGQAYGALYAIFLIGGAIGPALYGYLFDLSGTYALSLSCGAGLLVMSACGALTLRSVGKNWAVNV